VVLWALVDDVICLGLEPDKPDLTFLAIQQGERHKLAKVRCRAAFHTMVMLLNAGRGNGGRRLGR
jgi:hypothetical protein